MIGRYEWKYLINDSLSSKIIFNLKSIINKDVHSSIKGGYVVRSLYFDDEKNNAANDVESGFFRRKKYRIRYYNNNPSKLFLEKKTKNNDICKKTDVIIDKDEFLDIMNGNVLKYLYSTKQLLKELAVEIICKNIRPKIIIEYERIAYEEKITNTRITIDKNISVSSNINEFLTGNYVKFPLNCDNVLEIKFNDIFPKYIKNICNISGLNRISFSKYFLCYSLMNKGV